MKADDLRMIIGLEEEAKKRGYLRNIIRIPSTIKPGCFSYISLWIDKDLNFIKETDAIKIFSDNKDPKGNLVKCKNCKWWVYEEDRNHAEHLINPVDQDTWEPMQLPFEVRQCKNPKLLYSERPLEKDGFAVADASEYWSTLITAEDFYCKHFEREN